MQSINDKFIRMQNVQQLQQRGRGSNLKDADEDAIDDFHDNKFRRDTKSDVRIPVHCE